MPQDRTTGHRTVTHSRPRPGRVIVAVLAAAVLIVTGFGWRSVDSLTSNLQTVGDLGLGGGDDGAVDILLVGTDSRTDAHGNPLSPDELAKLHAGDDVTTNTDTIVLIRVPKNGRSATAISIPRDSYVNVPGIGKAKINSAYGSTKERKRLELVKEGKSEQEADKESNQAGRQALVKTVAQLTGITVDHYAEVGLVGFALLTDAVGGVDVCLNAPVHEPLSGADFPAGKQQLDGSQALSFVRQRHDLPRGDLDRIVRQQAYMSSLVHKVLSAKTLSNPSKLKQLSDAVSRSVVLDSDWDIINFAKQLQDLSGGQVKFQTIPVTDLAGQTDDGESVVRVDPDKVRHYVASLVDGGDKPSKPTFDRKSVKVNVANASGITGLAGRVSEALTAKGYDKGSVGNDKSGNDVTASAVFAGPGADDAAHAVARDLGGLPVKHDGSATGRSVRVVLATDYSGPGTHDSGDQSTPASTGDSGSSGTPVTPAPPIDAGDKNGPKCVN